MEEEALEVLEVSKEAVEVSKEVAEEKAEEKVEAEDALAALDQDQVIIQV